MTDRHRALARRAAAVGVVGSLAVHAAGFLWLGARALPDPGFELVLPDEVAFGLAEAVEVAPPPPAPSPPAELPPPPAPPPAPEVAPDPAAGEGPDAGRPEPPRDGGSLADAGPPEDAGDLDAGADDAGPPQDAARADAALDDGGPDDAGPSDAGVPDDGALADGAAVDAGLPPGAGRPGVAARTPSAGPPPAAVRLPAGAQLALRIDLASLRVSPVADEVTALLAALPDWRALLEGSGVEPLRDLDRLLIASPNLRRSRTLVAGRVTGDVERVREAVARLAAARGADATWGTLEGVPAAPWHDLDRTERVAALLDARTFTITRPEDLGPLLAVAGVRAEEGQAAAEALLAMPEEALVALEAEGLRAFASGPFAERVPVRAEAAARRTPDGGYAIEVRGRYGTRAEATDAAAFLESMRGSAAAHPLAGLVGLSGPLTRAVVRREGREVVIATDVREAEMRVLLRTAVDALAGGLPPVPPPTGR